MNNLMLNFITVVLCLVTAVLFVAWAFGYSVRDEAVGMALTGTVCWIIFRFLLG